MGVSVDYLIEQTRLVSGLRNNQLWSNAQIATVLTDGYHDLRDKMIVRFAHWFRDTYEFTLANGNGENVLDLGLVPNLEMVQGLDWLDSNGNPFTIDELPSFANRNAGNSIWPLGVGWNFTGFMGRNYMIDGSEFFVLPAQNAGGNYRLIYTPMAETLAVPTTPPPRSVSLNTGTVSDSIGKWTFPAAGTFNASDVGATFTVTNASNAGNNGAHVITAVSTDTEVFTARAGLTTEVFGVTVAASIQPTPASTRTFDAQPTDVYSGSNHEWAIAGGAFTASDVGAVITANMVAPNRSATGQYLIASVLSPTFVAVESENNGNTSIPLVGTFTVDRRQLNTIPTLPQALTPWNKYIVLFASLAIRASRRMPAADLQVQFNQISARVVAVTKQRSEGVRQAPITRGGYGGGYGGIGGV